MTQLITSSQTRTGAVLLVGTVLALVASCRGTQARKAMSYVETCTPGQPVDACRYALRPSDGHGEALQTAFPTRGLREIQLDVVEGVIDPTPERPLHVVLQFSFGYVMIFSNEADCETITKVLEPELGPPTRRRPPALGTPSKNDSSARDAVYWATEEGDWACTPPSRVTWYSLPLDGYRLGSEDDDHLDRFVKPAPKSAALWRKLGRALIDR